MILSIKIRWPSFGTTKTYNIYSRRNDESVFVKANMVPLVDNTDGNLFVVSNIAPDTEYWVYVVECIDNLDIPETIINETTSTPILNKIKIRTYL